LIDAYTQPFEVSKFKDHYEEALRELVEAKMKNLPAPEPAVEKKPSKVVDLMEALRKSLAQAAPAQALPEPSSAGGKTSGSREKPAAAGAPKAKTGAAVARTAAARKTKSA
jgi:DNA end-binding protein Ku